MKGYRNALKILVVKPEGNRQLGRHRCRYEDNIKINVREIRRDCGLDPCFNWKTRGELLLKVKGLAFLKSLLNP
jgi:hypothetical protein